MDNLQFKSITLSGTTDNDGQFWTSATGLNVDLSKITYINCITSTDRNSKSLPFKFLFFDSIDGQSLKFRVIGNNGDVSRQYSVNQKVVMVYLCN